MSLIKRGKQYAGALCVKDVRPSIPEAMARAMRQCLARLERRRWLLLACGGVVLLILLWLIFSSTLAPKAALPVAAQYVKDGISVRLEVPALKTKTIAVPRRTLMLSTLMLASGAHPLPSDYPGTNARGFKKLVGEYLPASDTLALRLEAIYALCDMRAARPLEDIYLTVGAISYEEQTALQREAMTRYMQTDAPERALKKATAAVPKAGESEHQTGLCVDIALRGTLSYASKYPLLRTEAGVWLNDNAWRYGFIIRYQDEALMEEGGCENIHLRYVGQVHAAAMHTLNITLEKYLQLLHQTGITMEMNGTRTYILSQKDDGGTDVQVPTLQNITAGLDNTGFVIITAQETY